MTEHTDEARQVVRDELKQADDREINARGTFDLLLRKVDENLRQQREIDLLRKELATRHYQCVASDARLEHLQQAFDKLLSACNTLAVDISLLRQNGRVIELPRRPDAS